MGFEYLNTTYTLLHKVKILNDYQFEKKLNKNNFRRKIASFRHLSSNIKFIISKKLIR